MYEQINEINLIEALKNSIENQKITHKGHLKILQKSETSGTLRTLEISGYFGLPLQGQVFVLLTDALDENLPKGKSLRLIKTSEIVEIMHLNESNIQFKTLNSVYLLEGIQQISNANQH